MTRILAAISWSIILAVTYSSSNVSIISQHTANDRFTIAIMREDSVLIPFAEYRDGIWSAPWPKPEGYSENTNELAELPKPWFERENRLMTTWYFRSSEGVPMALKASKTMKIENHCQSNWGLLTDYPGKALKAGEHHINIGIALDAEKDVESPLDLTKNTVERKKIVPLIQPAFDKTEGVTLAKIHKLGHGIHYPSIAQRRKKKLHITKLYRNKSPINGLYIYQVEARKEYKKDLYSYDPNCNTLSIFQGWVLKNRMGELTLIDSGTVVTDCDMKVSDIIKLLGIMRVGGRVFIVTEDHGYEDEGYSIHELKGSRIKRLLKVNGGGC